VEHVEAAVCPVWKVERIAAGDQKADAAGVAQPAGEEGGEVFIADGVVLSLVVLEVIEEKRSACVRPGGAREVLEALLPVQIRTTQSDRKLAPRIILLHPLTLKGGEIDLAGFSEQAVRRDRSVERGDEPAFFEESAEGLGGEAALADSSQAAKEDTGTVRLAEGLEEAALFAAAADKFAHRADDDAGGEPWLGRRSDLLERRRTVDERERGAAKKERRSGPLGEIDRTGELDAAAVDFQQAAGVCEGVQRIGALGGGEGAVEAGAQRGGVEIAHRRLHGEDGRHAVGQEGAGEAGQRGFSLIFPRDAQGSRAAGEDNEGHATAGDQGFITEALCVDLVLGAVLLLQDQDAGAGVAGDVEDVIAPAGERLAEGGDSVAVEDADVGRLGAFTGGLDGWARRESDPGR
jgi:hypothetical protein